MSSKEKYVVLERSGQDNEIDVQYFNDYWEALSWVDLHYTPDERKDLHVDVVLELEDGSRTTEI